MFAQFKCPGSKQTSAVFSNGYKELLSSSDKIRLWKIPIKRSEPYTVYTSAEFITSIGYYGINKDAFYASAFSGKKLIYDSEGNLQDSSFLTASTPSQSAIMLQLPNEKELILSNEGELKLYF